MKRSRAFILSEQLMTIMLQAGFILVLCTSFYQLISFYTRTQQVLTARNHAERVISFMDEKIRNAGLGLWRCGSSSAIREKLEKIPMLAKYDTSPNKGYKLPVALQWWGTGLNIDYIPLISVAQNSGDVLTVLYAQRNLSTEDDEVITAFRKPETNNTTSENEIKLKMLDTESATELQNSPMFTIGTGNNTNIRAYAVMEGLGVPMHIGSRDIGDIYVYVYGVSTSEITIPAGGELMALKCMQMFVHDNGDGQGRQFAYRELDSGGTMWDKVHNQEKGILDIYMEVDRDNNFFTLWVLATGGYDASLNTERPSTWPKEANPIGTDDNDAKKKWSESDYRHHIIYVSRATWKLNNIPRGFTWD